MIAEVVAEDDGRVRLGVAAGAPVNVRDLPAGKTGLLLHGLYVDPARQRCGIGRRLLDAALANARGHGYDGLPVKARLEAEASFRAQRLALLPVVDPDRDYSLRFWKVAGGHD